jgi:hypothetical protein
VVYERDHSRSARVQGSALDLHEESGLAALEAAGLMEAFWANHRPDLDRLRLTDASGTVLHDHARRMSGAGKRPEIERGPLRDLLLDSLEPGTVQWDASWNPQRCRAIRCCYVSRAEKTGLADIASEATARTLACAGWSLQFVRSMSVYRSSRRWFLLRKQTMPALWSLLGGAALMALGGERTIGMGTKPDGSVLVYAGLKTHDDSARQSLERATTPEQRVAWFHANFEGME